LALDRLERRCVPAVLQRGRHDVVVAVDEHGRLVLSRAQPVAVDDRVSGRREDTDAGEPQVTKVRRQPVGGPGHVTGERRVGADAGDAEQVVQLVAKSLGVRARISTRNVARRRHDRVHVHVDSHWPAGRSPRLVAGPETNP
jgi:hypothetical protein